MLMRCWQTALIAALAALMGNVVWAQEPWPQGGCATGYAPPAVKVPCSSYCPYQQAKCCEHPACAVPDDCCKEGKCCEAKKGDFTIGIEYECCEAKKCDCAKGGDCCCEKGKCDCAKKGDCSCKKGDCCKAAKCDCTNGGECCCKKGECKCNKSSCGKGKCCGRNAKNITIIMVMPTELPALAAHLDPNLLAPIPLPPAAHVMLPCPCPPPPPMLSPPGIPPMPPPPPTGYVCPPMPVATMPQPCPVLKKVNPAQETCEQLLSMASEFCNAARPMCHSAVGLLNGACAPRATPYCLEYSAPMNAAYGYAPDGSLHVEPMMPAIVPCTVPSPARTDKLSIAAKPSSDQLEMKIGDDTCLSCKKMKLTLGDNEITLSRFDDRVRVRGEELKATADSVRSDRKDRLILEGDVQLHYKKDGHSANVTSDRIELNLSSGAVTIKPAAKKPSQPVSY